MKKRVSLILLIFIIFGGFILRTYKLTEVPPSLNWDEIAAGYNAYTIAHWGSDEWGVKFPLVFTSFRDDKHPVHIYLTTPFVGLFGLTDFTTRFPAALFSTFCILLIYLLAKKMFNSETAGLFAAFFLAISPYHLHFSRGLWEIDFALFFFLLGMTLFYYGLEKPKLLFFAFFSYGISMYSYHSAKVIVPTMVLLLSVLYIKRLLKHRTHFILGILVFTLFIVGFVLQPRLLGFARADQTNFCDQDIQNTVIYQKTGNKMAARFEIALTNYPDYFTYTYLFDKGDQNPRNSVKVFGEFYKIDFILIIIGLIALVAMRSKVSIVLLTWLILAPIPSALSSNTPNATRAMFMLGSIHLIAALGAATILKVSKRKIIKVFLTLLIITPLIYECRLYLDYYFNIYPVKDAIEWQYGMKETVEFIHDNPMYSTVYMDKVRQQPYIFTLFYTEMPLPEFLSTVKYDETESKSYNTVVSYDRFNFGNWYFVDSQPYDGYLYVLEPYKYSGLRNINDFEVVKLVKYPDNTDAFYLVSVGK